ncbi:MAG: threonylcarbamoyl-AMP synthase [Bacteroidia bacterium]|nr:threonylcarbamoyl-AMP synthase [Bacteroidia bacterium]
MLVKIHPVNPSPTKIEMIVEILRKGGIIIYPTDSVYGLGCSINNYKGVERIAHLKGISLEKANFSIICYDLSQLSDYTRQVDNHIFKLMKRCLPGPFTFILNANNQVPRLFKSRKKTVGIRIPDNSIVRDLVITSGYPLVTTSIRDDDEIIEYTTDPELIYDRYKDKVDAIINGGYGNNQPSTVVDCTSGDPITVRQGIGILDV